MATASNIISGLSGMGFDASVNELFPRPMQLFFYFWGAFWFWTGMVIKGGALALWREMRAERLMDSQQTEQTAPDYYAAALA